MRRIHALTFVAALFLVVPVSTASLAADGTYRATGHSEDHCVAFVVDQKSDGEMVLTEPACFDDEAAADVWAGIGMSQIETAPNLSRGGAAMSSSFTLGKHYDGFIGAGSSITIVGSSCTGGFWNTSSTWDNRISSSYNGCYRLRHWDDPYKAGTVESTFGSGTTDNLSFMNNRTESVSYHSS